MRMRDRVGKLLERAQAMVTSRRRTARSRRCQGATDDDLARMIEEAIPEESYPVMEDIIKQIEEYHSRPPREIANGEKVHDVHGFTTWVYLLKDGHASLPEVIPPVVLLAWRNGYRDHPAGSTPIPVWRCEDCRMVLPNSTPDGASYCIKPCPVCGGERLAYALLGEGQWGMFKLQ